MFSSFSTFHSALHHVPKRIPNITTIKQFTTTGSNSFITPSNVSAIEILLIGGGGGGGGDTGGGGGGGGFVHILNLSV
jgi:uncharacterized membrane protein